MIDFLEFTDKDAEQYVQQVSEIIFASPNKTRDKIAWSSDQIKQIGSFMRGIDFLEGYTFSSWNKNELSQTDLILIPEII